MFSGLARAFFSSPAPSYRYSTKLSDESFDTFSKLYVLHSERAIEPPSYPSFHESKRESLNTLTVDFQAMSLSEKVEEKGTEVKNDEPFPVIETEKFHRLLEQNPIDVFLCSAKSLFENTYYYSGDRVAPSQSLLGKLILSDSNAFISLIAKAYPQFTKSDLNKKYISFALNHENYAAADHLIQDNPNVLRAVAKTLDEDRFNRLTLRYLEYRTSSTADSMLSVLVETAIEKGYLNPIKQICVDYPDLLNDHDTLLQALMKAILPSAYQNPNRISKSMLAESYMMCNPAYERQKLKIAEYLIDKINMDATVGAKCLDALSCLVEISSGEPENQASYSLLANKLMKKGFATTASLRKLSMFDYQQLEKSDISSDKKESKYSYSR